MEPTEKPEVKVQTKSLGVTDPVTAKASILDIVVWGDPNSWLVLSKASSEKQGWMKSTKILPIDKIGVVLQVTTQQRNPDGSYAVAEALQFIPGAKVIEEFDGSGNVILRRLRHL